MCVSKKHVWSLSVAVGDCAKGTQGSSVALCGVLGPVMEAGSIYSAVPTDRTVPAIPGWS